MNIYTIGFTKKSAEQFFRLLQQSAAPRLIDVRLNNVSQLAGFAKRDDLKYFLRTLCDMDYVHRKDLAPTKEMLDQFKKRSEISWTDYEQQFLRLLEKRDIADAIPKELFQNAVLLCSEDTPHRCHRRLIVEYLAKHWEDVNVNHLV